METKLIQVVGRLNADEAAKLDKIAKTIQKIPTTRAKLVAAILREWLAEQTE